MFRHVLRRSFHSLPSASKFVVTPEVREAILNRGPVVALESTIISHGMPYPQNVETARQVEDIVRQQGAVPATIALLDGKVHIGLTDEMLEKLGSIGLKAHKASRRDLPIVMAQRLPGATTVASTMFLARAAGIPLFVTGGIGGVHRGAEQSFDISADLMELGKTPVAVVCAGVKSILDIGKTLEVLETQGVSVTTYGPTNEFPAFYSRDSGFKSPSRVDTASEAASIIAANHELSMNSGMVFAVPIPEESAVDSTAIQDAIATAVNEARAKGITGKEETPYLLKRIVEITKGESLAANIALVKNNAKVGGQIAVELANIRQSLP
ncbi:erwinia chrysanthemi IndA protein-like protein-like protein [Radiomyces spectabilis]|uniref:erwinia chrysanthemi IndA protein-like protein-like protein n=1 Tax=Radiomyces spectabilis TaxID=64574 RepID=UPI00221FC2C3|nr:erwinia chrysanthemi IndA protein-like protein-like protein [Radiomyces spectabilis]KAI8381254.1 erwinia chrysanthemi IndA protein-like protein-like protein [Radiomyces spectabilis]